MDTTTRGTSRSAPGIPAPHSELLNQVLDKWSLEVLENLCERPMRFNELKREIPAVTQKSLSATLRKLERNGIVVRAVLSSRPIAVEYSITGLGKTLRAPVDALVEWAEQNLPAVREARHTYDEEDARL